MTPKRHFSPREGGDPVTLVVKARSSGPFVLDRRKDTGFPAFAGMTLTRHLRGDDASVSPS